MPGNHGLTRSGSTLSTCTGSADFPESSTSRCQVFFFFLGFVCPPSLPSHSWWLEVLGPPSPLVLFVLRPSHPIHDDSRFLVPRPHWFSLSSVPPIPSHSWWLIRRQVIDQKYRVGRLPGVLYTLRCQENCRRHGVIPPTIPFLVYLFC